MKIHFKAYLAIGLLFIFLIESYTKKSKPIYIQNDNLGVSLSTQGRIIDVTFKGKHLDKKISGYTALKGVKTKGKVSYSKMENGGVEFKRQVIQKKNGRSAEVIERFFPTKSSIRWDVEIHGRGKPWSTPINTHLDYPAEAKTTRFWTAWGRPQIGSTQLSDELKKALTPVSSGMVSELGKKGNQWIDPLVPVPFSNAQYYYGGSPMSHSFSFLEGKWFAIPIASIIAKKENTGLSLVLSPADEIRDMTLHTGSTGSLVFSRSHNRISDQHTVRFSMDLVAGKADWRGGLGWMVRRYPDYFNPSEEGAFDLGGLGAYSTHDANIDAEKFKRMDFNTNWKASFDFPYMGMFLPPVSREQPWIRFGGGTMTIDQMSNYATKMKQQGFHVLNYFNVTEFGGSLHYPPQVQPSKKASWKDPNAFTYGKLGESIFYTQDGMPFNGSVFQKKHPIFSWYHAAVMDPGNPEYALFLLGQAQRLVKEIPDASGIAIDRLDWLRLMNPKHDDGVTWFNGKPARSLIYSWKSLMERLNPIFHNAGQYVFVNPHIKRVDILKHVDGIFNESGDAPASLNTAALLGINKPVIQWSRNKKEIKSVGADAFFQKYLYMGSFPMAPFPGNDHSIQPGRWVNKQYLDYGPLFKLINKARWVLKPRAVSVRNRMAKANIFKVPQGYVVPVVYGGDISTAQVSLRGLNLNKDEVKIMAYYPGRKKPANITARNNSDSNQWTLSVPLHRGCAVVLVKEMK